MSRLEAGRIQYDLRPINPVEVINQVEKEMRDLIAVHQLSFEIQSELADADMMVADFERIKQVLINLISNAVKFTQEGGVTIKVTSEAAEIKVAVIDTGVGISDQDRNKLFEKFEQGGDEKESSTPGTGLGLYISKLLMEGMGGRIEIEHSEVGTGTMIAFWLPKVS
jgi:signal transduction histidine kinase